MVVREVPSNRGMGNGGSYQLCTLSAALPVTSNDISMSYADGT